MSNPVEIPEISKGFNFVHVLVLLKCENTYVEAVCGKDGFFRFGYDEPIILDVENWMPLPTREFRKDAERYRFLRSVECWDHPPHHIDYDDIPEGCWIMQGHGDFDNNTGEALDIAIDFFIEAEKLMHLENAKDASQ